MNDSFTHSLLIHSLIYSFIHAFIHSLVYAFIHSFMLNADNTETK